MAFFALALVGLLALVSSLGRKSGTAPVRPPAPRLSAAEKTAEFYGRAGAVAPIYEGAAHPSELIEHPPFLDAVAFLCGPAWSEREIIDYATGDNPLLAVLALEALGRRTGDPSVRDPLLDIVNLNVPWERFFALRALDLRVPVDEPVIGDLLLRLDSTWAEPHSSRYLREFIGARRARGEVPTFGSSIAKLDTDRADVVDTVLRAMPEDVAPELRAELDHWRGLHLDREFLGSVGALWDGDPFVRTDGPVIPHDALVTHASTVESAVLRKPHRSVVLVGEHGVGKTAVARSVARQLSERGWVVFEAGHAELVAGMPYMGQIEERLRGLVDRLRGRPVLWYVPEFQTLAMAGRHRFGPTSALDFLMPYVERGEVVVLGETRPGPYEHLTQTKPRVKTAFETVRVGPLDDDATTALIERWATGAGNDLTTPAVRREALDLAQQFLGDRAAPGNALRLLQITRERIEAGGGDRPPTIVTDDLVATLSMLTGLPATILDERKGLDLGSLRELFERRVLGQPEAVDALVERVAMIKAGTTDPTRPLGVFLFAGPTGTGKTEIAKALAEFLFGSPDRMIRLDMSEFQAPEALAKIVGEEGDDARGGALVDRIRRQPFAVVLLDEFEKANPKVWDLFLQVFDDGRLSDYQGRTADFRNAIIILTSNLGAVITSGLGVGFSEESGRFHATAVVREVERSFRKEFLNRLDRVVVFRPFSRETMRVILRKELTDAFRRRGLRNRAWSVEWDEGAIEFLLERGFTADLGARPLKRAVERYVLSPLSTTIVEHRVPDGDQFLFLRAEGDRMVVDFIDPDAALDTPAPTPGDDERVASADADRPLASIGLSPRGRPEEIQVLRSEHARLHQFVQEHDWHEIKRDGAERMRQPDFWHSTDRFGVLGRVEYIDRIEAGLQAAGSLLDRLEGPGWKDRERFPVDLVGRTASRMVLLDTACRGVLAGEPSEAFVDVQPWSEAGTPARAAVEFAREIAGMYRAWGGVRGMQIETLEELDGPPRGYELVMAVSGFGSWSVLSGESGLHVLELPEPHGHGFRKAAARVRVLPQPEIPPDRRDHEGLLAQARAALAAAGDDNVALVRHYRRSPSPLVRDAVHGWRTGHLDRVLAGDFDLRAAEASR